MVPSAGHSSSDRYKKSSQGSVLLRALYPSHCLLPFPCHRELGLDLPLPTETAWVFMGLPYTESWQISGETPACKKIKGKERSLRWGFRVGEHRAELCWTPRSPTHHLQRPQSAMPFPVGHSLCSCSLWEPRIFGGRGSRAGQRECEPQLALLSSHLLESISPCKQHVCSTWGFRSKLSLSSPYTSSGRSERWSHGSPLMRKLGSREVMQLTHSHPAVK